LFCLCMLFFFFVFEIDLSGDPKRRKMMFEKEMQLVIDKTKQQLLKPKGLFKI